MQVLGGTFRLYVLVSVLGFWLGGLTFYAAVVVPIGNRTLGSEQQGRITQQVTNYLNAAGLATAALLLAAAVCRRRRALLIASLLLLVAQAALYPIHWQLDGMLASRASPAADAADFYTVHQRYLIVTSIQWLAGLTALWLVLKRHAQ